MKEFFFSYAVEIEVNLVGESDQWSPLVSKFLDSN